MPLGPIDYSAAFTDPNANDLLNSFNTGLQAGVNYNNTALQQQQQQLQIQQAQQMRADAAEVAQNPTPQAIAQLSVKQSSRVAAITRII